MLAESRKDEESNICSTIHDVVLVKPLNEHSNIIGDHVTLTPQYYQLNELEVYGLEL